MHTDLTSQLISLSPKGALSFNVESPLAQLIDLKKFFLRDWREGWFCLAASKLTYDQSPSLRFWQELSKEYITTLCHIPEEANFSRVELPGVDRLNEWISKAPPMKGGEYISFPLLKKMWECLNSWVEKESRNHGGVHSFLRKKAPKWHQVGKVCFHLVENKKDPNRPFAFLATY